MKKKFYKVLVNGQSCHGGNLEWSLPDSKPGKWHKYDNELVPCSSGLHLTSNYAKWLKVGCEIYEAEPRGEQVQCNDDKIVCASARLLKRIDAPKWWRDTEKFILTLKDVPWFQMRAEPLPDWQSHLAPNWDAARNAALDATRNAALDTAKNAALDAAWNAALDATRDTAWDAARNIAWDAARDAARDAVRDAVRDAERDTARDAARDVTARDAAWDAAFYVGFLVCPKGKLAKKHVAHIKARWEVWTRGYGLLCDINGKLIVYGVSK